MAEAAEIPKKPSAKTWLASNAPSPPGNGTRNESQPEVHAATVCQNAKWIWRKDVIRKYSLTIPNAAINETSDAQANRAVLPLTESSRQMFGCADEADGFCVLNE